MAGERLVVCARHYCAPAHASRRTQNRECASHSVVGQWPSCQMGLRGRTAAACPVELRLAMGPHAWASLLLLWVTVSHSRPDSLRIVGLFENRDDDHDRTLRHAVDKVNNNRTVLPRLRLSAHIVRIHPQDSFHVAKKLCSQIDAGAIAVLGPLYPSNIPVVQSTCTTLNVPHLDTQPSRRTGPQGYSVHLHPHPTVLSRAYRDMVKSRGWKSFTIIYEDEEALPRLQHLIMMPNSGDVRISLRPHVEGVQYRKLLKDVGKRGETNIVLDVPANHITDILRQAHSVGMMTEYHNYFITSLDLHTVDLQDFQHGRSNISGFRLVVPSRTGGVYVPKEWLLGDIQYGRISSRKLPPVKTQVALMYDSVALLTKALRIMNHTTYYDSRSCSNLQPWNQGRFLLNYLKTLTIEGMTGFIKFDHHGFRTNFSLDVMELKRNGLSKVGEWDPTAGLKFTWNYSMAYEEVIQSLKNRTLKVTTILNPPYMMLKKPEEKAPGREQFEGFCVDLLREMSRLLGFRYDLRLVRDSAYGTQNDLGEWNGMVRELVDREADLAVADFTITYEREEVVDFTMPFMNLGISILFRRPIRKVPKLFWFLRPLSLEVWMYMATAYLGVSMLLFVVARFSPYEWATPHPCETEPIGLKNQFSIQNSLWFTIGSLMRQGSELTPRALSTRVVAATWWFFTLIMISSYTANLAAFLTVERMKSPIDNADDLAKQSAIQYGCVQSGSTRSFFKNSEIPVYKKMWTSMEAARPSVFTQSNSEGVERVLRGNYAFLMESTSIEFETQRNCELTQIGGLLDSKGYGIATPPGSPYRTPFSSAILKLQEDGILHALKERWWTPKDGVQCPEEEKKVGKITSELGIVNVGGIFVVLLAGMGCACIIVVVEFIVKTKYHRKRPH